MGDRGAPGGSWGARDESSWWPAGDMQNQQLNDEVPRSTPSSTTQQLYAYKMTGGFNNGAEPSAGNYEYRLIASSSGREESPQQAWWYGSGTVESHQGSSPTV